MQAGEHGSTLQGRTEFQARCLVLIRQSSRPSRGPALQAGAAGPEAFTDGGCIGVRGELRRGRGFVQNADT